MSMSSTRSAATASTEVVDLGRPWPGVGPFLFAAFHSDAYPRGTAAMGPDADLAGRPLGQDFGNPAGWNMYHGTTVPGFPAHPHRGFETITLVTQGYVDHADSTGASARYGVGDVQWVTAGKGVSHAEMFPLLDTEAENPFELFQVWLNLPAEDKSADPEFVMYWNEDIPVLTPADATGQVSIKVIAGAYGDVVPAAPPQRSWASRPDADVAMWLVELGPSSTVTLPAPAGAETERMLYVFGEDAALTIDGTPVHAGQGFAPSSVRSLDLSTAEHGARILLLQGRPIGEPVVAYGPFVMNSEADIRQAFEDYRRTEFGGWPWPVTDLVHPRETERFARYGDGRVSRPAD
ncbi:pirin family protein [Nocardioides sp.]|uniref:pirin family protein n=1 Tax=Nocardioides sp. TaxID=35761 RepID=UPI002623EF44|nr:pirin family protein [Nocardioides sp.]